MALAPPSAMDKALKDGILELAEAALFNDDLTSAGELYQEVLRVDPTNRVATVGLEEIDRSIRRTVPHDRPIRLAIPVPQLLAEPMGPSEAFVMSRLTAHRMTLDELTAHCPLPKTEVAQIVERFLEREVLAVS